VNSKRNLNQEREENESFEDYKKRRKDNKEYLKFYLKGEIIWESKTEGTYVRKKV
tara:strand:- start:1013 stop:1177 length:165 start_codon:yes stop_codon:yes gene_type:complete